MKVYIYRPAGNDTALIAANLQNPSLLSRKIFKLRSNVEQVGFISQSNGIKRLDMAGGELCFNALRSAARYFLSEDESCEIKHCEQSYKCYKKDEHIYTQIKPQDFALWQIDQAALTALCGCNILDAALVDLNYIVHLCGLIDMSDFRRLIKNQNSLKHLSMKVFEQFNLLDKSACGLMFIAKDKSAYYLAPVVWVAKLGSLFYESACGSGSFASYLFLRPKLRSNLLALKQPSGEFICLNEDKDGINISSFVQLLEVLEI